MQLLWCDRGERVMPDLEAIRNRSVRTYPRLTGEQLTDPERRLVAASSPTGREVILALRAFDCRSGHVDLTGTSYPFEFELVPGAVALLSDTSGGFWVLDPNHAVGDKAAVAYIAHDPPVIVFQFDGLDAFFEAALDSSMALGRQTQELCRQAEEGFGEVLDVSSCRLSLDESIRAFSESLPSDYVIIDLRNKTLPVGFAWAPARGLRRWNAERLFGVQPEARRESTLGRIGRLFKRSRPGS